MARPDGMQTGSRRHVGNPLPTLNAMLDSQPIFPVAGAYVLQLHRDARIEDGHWIGRIEHVASGESFEFTTREALVAWLIAHANRMREHPGS